MGHSYSTGEILQKCRDAMQDPGTFYSQGFINYRGICPDAKIPYTEIAAGFLCEHLQAYVSGIPTITRTSPYHTPTHDGDHRPDSNREEELIAMQMFRSSESGREYAHIGKILDYQTPLKDRQSDRAGKIDLLAYNGDTLRILELKKPGTEETMLRCVLEGFTYLKTADTAKLIADFNQARSLGISVDTPVSASPLVFENSRPHKEYLGNCPNLKKLMSLLDSKPFFIRQGEAGFEIFE